MDHRIAALGLVVAQHYRLLKTKVTAAKESGKNLPLTPEEAALADYLGDTIEGMVGKRIGNYCREHFQIGWISQDLRSYKIKFVLTKLRDLLPEGKTKEELVAHLEDYVAPAEALAGCTADGKRRNKAARAEQARLVQQHREERAKAREERKALKAAEKQARLASQESHSGPVKHQMEFEDLLAEVDSSSSPSTDETVKTVKLVKIVKVQEPEKKPVRRKTRKTPEERAAENVRKLEHEILSKEYGETQDECDDREDREPEEMEDGTEDYGREDREYVRDDLVNHFAHRSFSGGYGDFAHGRYDSTGYNWSPDDD